MTPVVCPICTRSSLQRIAQGEITEIRINNEAIPGGLIAFRCTEFDHVFLVRKSDVEADAKLEFAP